MARKLTLAMVLAVIGLGLSAQTYTTTSTGAGTTPDTVFVRTNGTGVPVQVQVRIKPGAQGTGTATWGTTLNIVAQNGVDADGVAGGATVNVPATNNVPVRWVLTGFIFVNNGQTLTVSPGAVVWAQSGTAANAKALIVQIGGRLVADGTVSNPIIFTYEGDDITNNTQANDFAQGLWGGVVICGDAPTNLLNEKVVEGLPTTESRGLYGGPSRTNAAHDGGIVNYVSIRNTGTAVESSSELQGLTLAGCGTGTVVDYVEAFVSADDGIEVFGGTVNISHFVAAFIDDDMFDFDQGWSGRGQFWFGYQYDNDGNRGGEWDGDDANESTPNVTANGQPYTNGRVANMTIIANKRTGSGTESRQGVYYRNNCSISLYNSIISGGAYGIVMEDRSASATAIPNEWDHFVATPARSVIRSVVAGDIGDNPATTIIDSAFRLGRPTSSASTDPALSRWRDSMNISNNEVLPSAFIVYPSSVPGSQRIADLNSVNPVPSATTGFPTPATLPSGFATANYIGAFGPTETGDNNWMTDWTLFDELYVTSTPTNSERPQAPLYFESYTFGPNPTSGTIFVRMQVKQSVDAQFDLINVNGQVLRTKSQYLTANGETHVVEVDANGLGNGVYFLRSRNRTTGDLLRTDRVVKQ